MVLIFVDINFHAFDGFSIKPQKYVPAKNLNLTGLQKLIPVR